MLRSTSIPPKMNVTDGRTDEWMNGRTDRPTYRGASWLFITEQCERNSVKVSDANKSNRVRTIDAFSCVLALQHVLVIALYYYYLTVV